MKTALFKLHHFIATLKFPTKIDGRLRFFKLRVSGQTRARLLLNIELCARHQLLRALRPLNNNQSSQKALQLIT